MKNYVFHSFFKELLVKTHSKTSGKPVRSFWTGLSLPRPFPTHFTSILYFATFCLNKKCLLFYVFPIFSLFFQLWRLQDQSQIVDLIFPLKPVSSRASETPKVPHSWQNNVQNVSQEKYAKSRHNHQPAGWWFASHQPAGWWFADHQPWSPNPTLVAFWGPGHPKTIFKQKQQN